MVLDKEIFESVSVPLGIGLSEQLEIALKADDPAILKDYLLWQKRRLMAQGFHEKEIIHGFHNVQDAAASEIKMFDTQVARDFFSRALSEMEDIELEKPTETMFDEIAEKFKNKLLQGQRQEASSLIMKAVKKGMDVRDIYIHVFQRSLYEVGRLWQLNQVSIAQEHFFTAATQMIMSQLYPYIFSSDKNGKRMVAASVDKNMHDIGIRMVADFFEMNGWDTYYLGGNSPADVIIQAVGENRPHLLALSVTTSQHIEQASKTIEKIREMAEFSGLKIILGGHPFNIVPGLWKKIGGDGYAGSADGAVAIANELVGLN